MTEISDALFTLARQLAEGPHRPSPDVGQRVALAAALTPALAGLKRRVAGLGAGERAAAFARVKHGAADAGHNGRMALALAAIVGLLPPPRLPPSGLSDELMAMYLLLWLIDQDIMAAYSARNVQFDLTDPSADFWYPRIDGGGTHVYAAGGNYLTISIPMVTEQKHYDAEIYNSIQTAQEPRNLIANLFPVDNPHDVRNYIYDLFLNVPFVPANGLVFEARIRVDNLNGGSRGWGFWNTDVLPLSMQIAWFIQLQGKANDGLKPVYPDGFYAVVQNGITGGAEPILLPPLDEQWHDYRIEVSASNVEFCIDGKSVAQVTDTAQIPAAPMAFHYWVDNTIYGFNDNGLPAQILQTTDKPRSNTMKTMTLKSRQGTGNVS